MINILNRYSAGILLTLSAAASQAQTCSDPATLRIAFIPQEANQAADGRYDGLVATLGEELRRSVALIPVGSYGAVIEGLIDGSIDLAELGPGSYALARDRGADIQAFATMSPESAEGPPGVYSSVLITRRDSGFHSIADLRGASVSLVDPASTSGSMVPRLFVQRATMVSLESWFGRVSFAGSHDRSIEVLLNNRVDAAFVSDTKLRYATYQGRPADELLRVVWRSQPIPSDPYAYQNGLCEPLKQAIRRTFLFRQDALQALLARRRMAAFVPVDDEAYSHLMSRGARKATEEKGD